MEQITFWTHFSLLGGTIRFLPDSKSLNNKFCISDWTCFLYFIQLKTVNSALTEEAHLSKELNDDKFFVQQFLKPTTCRQVAVETEEETEVV